MSCYDEGKDEAWRDLLLSNIGKEKMDSVRTLSEQLLRRRKPREVGKRPQGRLPDPAAQPHRRDRDDRAEPARAVHVPAPDRGARAPARGAPPRRQSERDRLEAEVARRTGQLTELAQHLQTIREDERSRLARELHDELGALLTAAKLDVARLKSRLGETTPEVAGAARPPERSLNGGIALKRRIIEDLRPRR